MEARVIGLEKLGKHDVELVGGKNSSLGEMISHLSNAGVSVPGGFATTAAAYREFLDQSGLNARIQAELAQLNVDDVIALAETGAKIRNWIVETPLTASLEQEVRAAFTELSKVTQILRLQCVLLPLPKTYQTLHLQDNKKLSSIFAVSTTY